MARLKGFPTLVKSGGLISMRVKFFALGTTMVAFHTRDMKSSDIGKPRESSKIILLNEMLWVSFWAVRLSVAAGWR